MMKQSSTGFYHHKVPLFLAWLTQVTAAVFAGRWRGQTRTLPIFNLASYHGRQSHPLDADLIKDNEPSWSSQRSVSDSSLLQRRLNKTLSGKWWHCFLGGRRSTNASVWLLSVATVTVKGRGWRLEQMVTQQLWLRPLLARQLNPQKTHCGENEPEVSSPITFQINFCPLILFKVDVSFILALWNRPSASEHLWPFNWKMKKKRFF